MQEGKKNHNSGTTALHTCFYCLGSGQNTFYFSDLSKTSHLESIKTLRIQETLAVSSEITALLNPKGDGIKE